MRPDYAPPAFEAIRNDPPTRRFTIRICDDCFNLKGQMCSTPDCLFCWRFIAEIGSLLDALLIRPVIDGERLTADEGELEPR